MDRTSKRHAASWSMFFVIFAILNSEIIAGRSRRRNKLEFSDCGSQDKIIHFNSLHATPVPVLMPGTLYVSIAGNVTADLPRRVNVYLTIHKYFYTFPFRIPCLSNDLGSCSYENICAILEQFETLGCPAALRYQGIPCMCPFLAGQFDLRNVAVNTPKIEGFVGSLLNGKYELQMVVQEEDGPELGCLNVHFSIRKPRRRRT